MCCVNQIIERDRDALMTKTVQRPLASRKMSVYEAGTFGVTSGIAGTTLLYFGANPVVAALGAGNIFFIQFPIRL